MRTRDHSILSARSFAVAAGIMLLSACGGGDGGTAPQTTSTVSVSLAGSSITVGATTNATAVARTAQGTTLTGKTASWSSSSTSIATVDASGVATGVSPGSANIIASIDGITGTAAIVVTPPPVSTVTVALQATSISVNQTTTATATLKDVAGTTLTGRAVTWSSSNTTVATVSNLGVVTGLSAGTTNIVATSEGRSGQVSLTVTPQVSVSALSITDANGQAVDVTNVAGKIRLGFDQQLPVGFRGVREVRIGGALFVRDSVFGSASVPAQAIRGELDVETPAVISAVSANELRSQPLAVNGPNVVTLGLSGSMPDGSTLANSATLSIRLNNPDAIRLHIRPERQVPINGRNVMNGNLDVFVEDLAYSGNPVTQIDIARAPAQATYGSAATAGVVNLVTRSGTSVRQGFTILRNDLNFESPATGNRIVIRGFTRGGVTYNLGDILQSNGYTTAPDGSLLYYPFTGTPSNGLRFTYIPPFNQSLLQGYQPVTNAATYIDNIINAPAGVFSPLQPNTQVGSALYVNGTQTGTFGNRFGRNHDFRADVSYTQFNDLSGIDVLKTTFRVGNALAAKSSWTSWTPTTQLPLSANYDWAADATFEDGVGNKTTVDLVTNALNNIGIGGVATSVNQRATFSSHDPSGTITFGGTSSTFENNWPTIGTARRTIALSGVTQGLSSPFGAWSVTVDGKRLFGIQSGTDLYPELYNTTGNGTSGDASFDYSAWTSKASSLYGTDQGVYKATLEFRLNDGQRPITAVQTHYLVNDRDRPTASGLQFTGTPSPRAALTGAVSAIDGIGLSATNWGYVINTTDSRFDGGRPFFFFDRVRIGTGVRNTLLKTATAQLSGTWPGSITMADNGGGFTNSSPLGVAGLVSKVSDLADNTSAPVFSNFSAYLPVRQTAAPTLFQQLQSGPAACYGPASACGSTPRTVMLDAGMFHSTATPLAQSVEVFGIHVATKRVYCFGESSSLQTVSIGNNLWRTFFFVEFDAKKFEGDAGAYLLYSIARSALNDYFVSNFQSFTFSKAQF